MLFERDRFIRYFWDVAYKFHYLVIIKYIFFLKGHNKIHIAFTYREKN